MLKFWFKILASDNCILKSCYRELVLNCTKCTSWATYVRNLLCSLGLNYLWENQWLLNTDFYFINNSPTSVRSNETRTSFTIRGIIWVYFVQIYCIKYWFAVLCTEKYSGNVLQKYVCHLTIFLLKLDDIQVLFPICDN